MPPGLFEMLSVRAHREKHYLKFLNHWGGGFHARHKMENVQVIILQKLIIRVDLIEKLLISTFHLELHVI